MISISHFLDYLDIISLTLGPRHLFICISKTNIQPKHQEPLSTATGMGWVGMGRRSGCACACASVHVQVKKSGIRYWEQAAHHLVGDISIEFYEVSLNWES